MKHSGFFPILIKEEVLKNMDLSDRLSFSKCSKKCRRLLSRVPNHLDSFIIPHGHQCSIDDFLTLIACRKSIIHKLKVAIETADERDQVNHFLLKLNEVQNSLKVKTLIMEISFEYPEMYKRCIDFCDPSFIESMKIKQLGSQEIYEEILKTPHWKHCQRVSVFLDFDGSEEVNIDDFLHFTGFDLEIEELSVENAWKLIQKVRYGIEGNFFYIKSQKPIQEDFIRQKIETEMVGRWKHAYLNEKYIPHPQDPDLVFTLRCNRIELAFQLTSLEAMNNWRQLLLLNFGTF